VLVKEILDLVGPAEIILWDHQSIRLYKIFLEDVHRKGGVAKGEVVEKVSVKSRY
jgi:hypothetical protein